MYTESALPRVPAGKGAGMGSQLPLRVPPVAGLKVPLERAPLSGISAAASSSKVKVSPLAAVQSPLSIISCTWSPWGPTRITAALDGQPWVKSFRVTVTLVTAPSTPATVMFDG